MMNLPATISNEPYQPNGLSVVIPNYNGVALLTKTMPPLHQALATLSVPWEVILVDDCSTDNSVSFVKQNFAWINVIAKDKNEGFSKTINTGIRQTRYELVFLMNSDIILTPDYFSRQFRYFNHPQTFGVAGRIIGWDDDFIQDGARLPVFELCKLKISRQYIPAVADGQPMPTLYLSGANVLVNREKLLALNGFDEIFTPFYAEDLDLSVRAWRRGWFCYYEHHAICRHKVSSSIRTKERKRFIKKIYYRNKLFFHGIHLPSLCLSFYLLQVFLEAVFRLVFLSPTLLQSFILFIAERKKWINSRKGLINGTASQMPVLSLRQVAKKIRRSVQKKAIITFRSGKIKAPTP
jgi:GT2 family glycosyltransferase